MKKEIIKTEMKVKDNLVRVMRVEDVDYISLTDLAKYQNENDPSGVIRNWMSNKNSFEFYNLWEELHNENFNSVESHRIKIEEVEYNRFTMTPNIKENIIPTLAEKQKQYIYANEADILNVALFGMTAKEWKEKNPNLDGNMRDSANILQLAILINLENLNAEMINQGIEQSKRLERLNEIAKKQYKILQNSKGIKKIENLDNNHHLLNE